MGIVSHYEMSMKKIYDLSPSREGRAVGGDFDPLQSRRGRPQAVNHTQTLPAQAMQRTPQVHLAQISKITIGNYILTSRG